MSSDFIGLKVIWPPTGIRPPKHEHDIVFVHGLHHGSISDWQDDDGVCWPAELLSLDLGKARVLAFGYDPDNLNLKSDSRYKGGLLFNHGEDLWTALKTMRRFDKVQVPITLIGHGTGGIVIKSALCISHFKREQFDSVLSKTKHVVLLSAPQIHLTWEAWTQITHGTSSAGSKDQWKAWLAANDSSRKTFDELAQYINVTSVSAEHDDVSPDTQPDISKSPQIAHHTCHTYEGVNHATISNLDWKSTNYKRFLACIHENISLVIHEPHELQRIRSWLGRRSDDINLDSHQRNLSNHHPGTGDWLFQNNRFREWALSDKPDPILWLVGPGGCGKSVLCSLAAERMQKNVQQQAVVYLMLAFDNPRSEYQMFSQIALQLLDYVVQHRGGVDAESLLMLPKEHDDEKKTGQVCELIQRLVSQCPAIFIFVDGLDEVGSAEEPERQPHEKDKLESLRRQLRSVLFFLASLTSKEEGTPVRLWCSSKQTSVVDNWMQELEAVELPMDRHVVATDIAHYLEQRIAVELSSDSASASPNARVIEHASKAAKNNFLFASQLADMLRYSNDSANDGTEAIMLQPPKDTEELCQQHLNRLHSSSKPPQHDLQKQSPKALQIISLVASAKRPLKLVELQEALAMPQVYFQDGDIFNLITANVEELDGDEIQNHCAPFIRFHSSQKGSKAGYLRVSHASIFDFLRQLTQKYVYAVGELRISSNLIAEACLKYLSQKRYGDTRLSLVRTHHFYTYAAKYWHRHINEADPDPSLLQAATQFMRSPQFLTMTRFQSYLLDRHFVRSFDDSRKINDLQEPQPLSFNAPSSLGTKESMETPLTDYKYFIREWGRFLSLGVAASEPAGTIEHCCWGALGKQSTLREHGLVIEKNTSFLLEMDEDATPDEDMNSSSCFYDSISDDGSRISVWKVPGQSSGAAASDQTTLTRESWYIDGNDPPSRDGACDLFDLHGHRRNSCGFCSGRQVSLIPSPATTPMVPVLDECSYAAVVRVGSSLFHRDQERVWTGNDSLNQQGTSHWNSTVVRGPWIVMSHRKQIPVRPETSDQSASSKSSQKPGTSSTEPKKARGLEDLWAQTLDAEYKRPALGSQAIASNQVEVRPMHTFSPGIHCDICGLKTIRSELRDEGVKEDAFYQCSSCTIGDCYDICSACFEKGSWCKNQSHLLSKCLVVFSTNRYYWEDGISQQTASPLVRIIAVNEERERDKSGGDITPPSFKYTRRHAGILHDSQPIVHPTLPLLVYPLDGQKLLLGNLETNIHLIYDVPFEPSETSENGTQACTPVSVSLRFSPCGNYVHMIRFTARDDPFLGPIALHAVLLNFALSSDDACSGEPRILSFRQSTDLGLCPRLITQIPYTITWTDSDAYISMSSDFLRVFRFPLRTDELLTIDEVCSFSQKVPLPQSARSRSVHFFPPTGTTSARLILGSLHGDHPQPPIVVLLKNDHANEWIPADQRENVAAFPPQIRDDPMIETPYVDDDEGLITRVARDKGVPILEPQIPIRDHVLRAFKMNGLYCPSCFELGLKIGFLRPNPKVQFHYLNFLPSGNPRLILEWRVSVSTLVSALKAGCQFCCYVASRLLNISPIRHNSQSVGRGGVRCCAEGSVAEDPKAVKDLIDNIQKGNWKVPREEQIFVFRCEPLNMNIETRYFDKMSLTLPNVQVGGKFNDRNFAPTIVSIQGTNEAGETHTITTFLHDPKNSHRGTSECVLELYSVPGDAAQNLIETRPLTTSRGKDENLDVIESWLKECQCSHSFCQQRDNTKAPLPTRLLEIVDTETIRLVEPAGELGQYVALSYCWGRKPEENYMTNVASFRARTDPDGFPRSGLPATIRDAVTVTESLGIKYIWVDALCMIQDDIVDKHSELGKMSQYYRNSFLTIAASTPSCTTGFVGTVGRCEKHLDSPLPRDVVPFDVFAHLQDKDEGRAGKVYVREENIYRLHEEPINKRAWTLQECILAPRVLLFGSRVIWFCQHMTHSDGGVEDWSFGQNELERTRREFQIELNKLDKEGSNANKWADTTSNQDIYDLWHRLVGEYSSRALSWPADKFPAISAVAAEFSKLTSDEYLAGLWRSNLPRDLLWTTPEAATHRPNTWRAPSWSWASVEDAVFYNQPPPKNVTLLAAVLEVDAVPLTDMAPFGEVARCNLVLTAPSFPMKLTDEADREEYSKPWLKDFKFKPGRTEREMLLESLKLEALKQVGTSDGNADEDVKKEFRLPNEMFVVCIYGKRNELFRSNDTGVDLEDTAQEWTMWGLILKKAGEESGEQVFERVLSFSQVMVGCDDAFLSRREQFRII